MDPAGQLRQIASAYWLSRCLHVVAGLGIADEVPASGISVAELAERVEVDADALRRVVFLLAGHGVFSLDGATVSHTPASDLLREAHPSSVRPMVRMFGLDLTWAAYGELEHAVRTGTPALDLVAPGGFFTHLAGDEGLGRLFDSAMRAKSQAQIAAVLAGYDFTSLTSIADIGGGRGHLLEAVLGAAPDASGILFDLPRVVAEATFDTDRARVQGGDFFEDPLPACDAYLLSQVLHDWDDDQATAILGAIRRAALPGARLLVIETVLSPVPAADWPSMLDIHMLVLQTGRERTRDEYAQLLAASGFHLDRVIDTRTDVQILDAVTD